LALALKQVNIWITDPDADEDLNLKDKCQLFPFGTKIKISLRDVWKDPPTDVFDIGYEFKLPIFAFLNSYLELDHRKKSYASTGWRKRLEPFKA
jgi:hypothetical protein